MDRATVLQAVRSWTIEERLEFMADYWDHLLEDGWQPEPNEELVAELERRLAAHEADPTNVLTWEQVRDGLRKR